MRKKILFTTGFEPTTSGLRSGDAYHCTSTAVLLLDYFLVGNVNGIRITGVTPEGMTPLNGWNCVTSVTVKEFPLEPRVRSLPLGIVGIMVSFHRG